MRTTIIGVGRVGSAIAFSLLHKPLEGELVLVDVDERRLEGEYLDLAHAAKELAPNLKIKTGRMKDATDSETIIISAGKAREPRESMDYLRKVNSSVVAGICLQAKKYAPNARVIVVTNPARAMLGIARRFFSDAEIPDSKLDEMRFAFFKNQNNVRSAGHQILRLKGYTNWGVAAAVASMI